jgi:hypothetical protein
MTVRGRSLRAEQSKRPGGPLEVCACMCACACASYAADVPSCRCGGGVIAVRVVVEGASSGAANLEKGEQGPTGRGLVGSVAVHAFMRAACVVGLWARSICADTGGLLHCASSYVAVAGNWAATVWQWLA